MDIRTFTSIAKQLPANHSVLIRGPHGIGKSDTVRQLAASFGLECIDRRVSQLTEGDIVGLPKVEDGRTKFLPADFVKTACERPVVLFLDEINRATMEVMQACFQLCLDREMNGYKLHPETRVFAAVNNSAEYQVNEMDPAFLDRFWVVDLSPSADDFFDYAASTDDATGKPRLTEDLLKFLKENPRRLEPSGKDLGNKDASRRSWFRLDAALRNMGTYEADCAKDAASRGRAYSTAVGYVGLECAADFAEYLARRDRRYTADDVFDRYEENRESIKGLPRSKLISLIDEVTSSCKNRTISVEDARNLGDFVGDLPAELRVSFITAYTRETHGTPNFESNYKTIAKTVMQHIIAVYTSKEDVDAAAAAGNKATEEEDASEEAPAATKKSAKKAKK